MKVHHIEIWFEAEELTPHIDGYDMMILREVGESQHLQAIIVPELYIDNDGKIVSPEKAIIPTKKHIEDQVISIVECCKKLSPGELFIHLVRRKDNLKVFGLCADIKEFEKWAFEDFALPGMQVADIKTLVNGKKNLKIFKDLSYKC